MNTVFVSIGRRCDIHYNIEKFIKKEPTNFFDWLRSDFICVNHLLKIRDISKELLFRENLIIYDHDIYNSGVEFKTFKQFNHVLLSHHDLPIASKLTENDIQLFLDKYKRRFERMIDIIKGNKIICFVRSGDINIYEKDEFVRNIKAINPNCKFCLVSLSSENTNNENTKVISNETHFLKLNFEYFKIPEDKIIEKPKKEHEWIRADYDWRSIFSAVLECSKTE
jgi:hypothetical protein